MSAFDTSTNTGSTTFTNAYGTVSLLPSGAPQRASGFGRTTGWRYFEVYVDAQGGDNSRLFAGVEAPPYSAGSPGWLIGGANKQTGMTGMTFNPAYPYTAGALSITACVGDTLMFSVDMTGNGRLHDGTVAVTTLTDGSGNILTRLVVEVGKNGTWAAAGLVSFAWPSHGYPMRVVPWVARDSTSASSAMVSLRVQTTSFAYAIPTGMVAWGDGPEGGAGSATDTSVYWDPAKISSKISLSESNQYATFIGTSTFTTSLNNHWIYSTQLPSSGKRVIETYQPVRGLVKLGLCLADLDTTITSCVDSSTRKIGRNYDWVFYRRGASIQTSITQSDEATNFYGETPGQVMYIDFDAGRFWHTGGLVTGDGARQECWTGDKDATALADPFAGTGGITFTNSIGMRLGVETSRNQTVSNASIYLNVGQRAFETFPLLPPYKSMNGGRQVYGIGAKWNAAVAPASVSFVASDLIFRSGAICEMKGTIAKSSGKYYFEIFRQAQGTVNDWVGVSTAGATTISATNAALVMDHGMWFNPSGTKKSRYGTTLSWTNSSSSSQGGDVQGWFGIAVDFDAGKIWCGCWNRNDRTMRWVPGADPSTGTQPDFTFTASTTLNISVITSATNNVWALVGEDTNVIGLPGGFETWNGTTISVSPTATPSGTVGGGRVLWPYGVQT